MMKKITFTKMPKITVWNALAAGAVVCICGYLLWRGFGGTNTSAQAQPPRPVPVVMASVEKTDFPVYLNGLGTVQGLNTVVVRTRVDGQINKISFTEGQTVQKGDVLAEIDPRPYQAALEQATAKKAQDQATLGNAQLDLQRYNKLGDFSTTQQKDTQRTTVAQVTAQIAADDAAIDNAQTQLDYATIRAPISGLAGLRQVDQGNIVNASSQTGIVTIAQVEPIAVIFTAPEGQLVEINTALKQGELKVIALSADGKKTLSEGLLSVVNNQVDTTSGTVKLKAIFDNKDHLLWPGLSVSTRLLIETLKDAVVIPSDAIQHGNDGLYAFSVDKDNRAQLRKIKVAQSTDNRTVVESGLDSGQRVIVSGQYRVQPGTLVGSNVANADDKSSGAQTE